MFLVRRDDTHLNGGVDHAIQNSAAPFGCGILVSAIGARPAVPERSLVAEGRLVDQQDFAQDLDVVENGQRRRQARVVQLLKRAAVGRRHRG